MARILVLGDERKGHVTAQVHAVAERLRVQGHEVDVDLARTSSLAERRADLVVVFGGDGSILAAARRMGGNQLPTLGVNLGRLGFLTAFGDDEADLGIERALRGELVEEPRLMFECRVERADGSVEPEVLCLNDVVLSRGPDCGMATILARRPDRELATYTGDGLIVATPVGSTAYSLAAGGPVLSPRLEALVLTPLAPHTLTLRPLVLPVGGGLRLRIIETGGGDDGCHLSVDGQVSLEVRVGDEVVIEPSPHGFRHLTRGPASFFATLREKFGWSSAPRRPERS